MTQIMVDMTQYIAKGFELMVNQMGSKGIIEDSGSFTINRKEENVVRKFSHENDLIIDPMNFR